MDIIGKKELMIRMQRFMENKKRGISLVLFSELCGTSANLLKKVFKLKTLPMTEATQIRVSRALLAWERGEYEVKKGFYGTTSVVPRRSPKPALYRHVGLQLRDGRIQMDIGIRRRLDTTRQTFEEQLNKR